MNNKAIEILAKFIFNLLFKVVVGILVFFVAQHFLKSLDWRTVVAFYVSYLALVQAKITYK